MRCTLLGSLGMLAVNAGMGAAPAQATATAEVPIVVVYDGGLKPPWQDQSLNRRDTFVGHAARIDLSDMGYWQISHPSLSGTFTALSFNVLVDASWGDFLSVSLGQGANGAGGSFPELRVKALAKPGAAGAGGVASRGRATKVARKVRLTMAQLNPNKVPFDRIFLRAGRPLKDAWVEVDQVVLWGPEAYNTGRVQARAWQPRALKVLCQGARRPISPRIYGTAYNPQANHPGQWATGTAARRWGGNTSSRYNWQLGNAWNLAADWFFKNADVAGGGRVAWQDFLAENHQHQVLGAVTIPMLGWVAKDTSSYSYPVAQFGRQERTAGPRGDMGNGRSPAGVALPGADPTRTSVAAGPEQMDAWVRAMEQFVGGQPGASSPDYILDNEPSLWHLTHRDVHPEPVGYDELIERTVAYAQAVRRAAPKALIAGPAAWGWPAYFFSARDAQAGFARKPDRLAHGDVGLLAYYLRELARHRRQRGERLLDILDVHYYPQVEGIFGRKERTDGATCRRRVEATRSLWDPGYVDASYIGEPVQLLPRMQALIRAHDPQLKLSLGEYNFGGEHHVSGAVAQAEVLGRLGQAGIHSAYFWTYPGAGSAVAQAFRAYRNYDGQGGAFLPLSVPTEMAPGVSLFAAQNAERTWLTLVIINRDDGLGAEAEVTLEGCGNTLGARLFQYAGEPEGLHPIGQPSIVPEPIVAAPAPIPVLARLPPWSITVAEVALAPSPTTP